MKIKVGQKLICFHYKDMPTCVVTEVRQGDQGTEVWVKTEPINKGDVQWWGPPEWFKASARLKKKKKTPRRPRPIKSLSGLCDDNVPGCSCNQAASVGH